MGVLIYGGRVVLLGVWDWGAKNSLIKVGGGGRGGGKVQPWCSGEQLGFCSSRAVLCTRFIRSGTGQPNLGDALP